MGKYFHGLILVFILLNCSKHGFSKEVSLTSKDFQKEFLQKVSNVMRLTAMDYLNNFLKDIKKPNKGTEDFDNELKAALMSNRLEPKIVFIKQYLDMAEHKDISRENMYGLRNVIFLKKLKDKLYDLQEQSFEEIHQLRYFYLCKQFKIQQPATTPAYHNYYSRQSVLAAIDEQQVGNMLSKLGLKDNHTVTLDIKQFGQDLYEKVKHSGANIIDDFLVIIRKLLKEVLSPDSAEEESVSQLEALNKILLEIEALLNTQDFYTKRQRLYDYLQNHLAFDYEQIQNSNVCQNELQEISEKLAAKGLDLVVAYLFSNFEFIDHLHDHWQQQLPPAPLSLYDVHSRPLKQIQQFYDEFKQDFENSTKYDSYLEAVKQLQQQTQQDNNDPTHIYEMLYSAAQNVGSSRATLMNSKCNEI